MQQDFLKQLATDPYRWQIKKFDEGVASELQDMSQLLRGRIMQLEDILTMQKLLKDASIAEMQKLAEQMEKDHKKGEGR